MSTKTSIKRIALVAVAALGFGMVSTVSASAAPNKTLWNVTASQTESGEGTATTTATQIVGANNYVELTANDDYEDANTITVLKVTGSTIIYTATGANSTAGVVNSALTEVSYADDLVDGNVVRISAATAGTVYAKYYSRAVTNGVPTDTLRQTITITVSAVKKWSNRYSTATIAKNGNQATVAGSGQTDILAPKGSLNAAAIKVASITIDFEDDADTNLSTPTGEYPAVRAVVSGPGNVQFNGENAVGRDISLVTVAQAPVIDIFNDGTAGTSTISIYVDGVLWTTKSLKFYGTVSALAVTQGLYVASTTGGSWGCGNTDATCDGSTVALTPAAVISATDALGTPVPFLSFSAVSSDTTVYASSTTAAETVATGTGSYNANVVAVGNGTSGKTATVTYRTLLADGVTYVSAAPLTYAIGGAATAIKFSVEAAEKAGLKGTFTLSKTDASGNKAYDAIHAVAFKSNVAVTASIFPASSNTQTNSSSNQMIINGSKTWDFFNPLVASSVTFDVTVDSLLTGTQTFAVGSASQDALDAANEATDAANAATDAANAAAEAADAATAAAQDAQAAVAELATKVAALMAGIKAQITSLTNLVIKIQKKVKA